MKTCQLILIKTLVGMLTSAAGGTNVKKVGLVTPIRGVNYGMVLQSYALQYHLDKLGLNPIVIRIEEKKDLDYYVYKLEFFLRTVTKPPVLRSIFRKRLRNKKRNRNPILQAAYTARRRKIDAFVRDRFSNILVVSSRAEAREAVKDFDAVIVGSDQQWHPGAFFGYLNTLMFVPDDITKISYATSLGVSSIPKCLEKRGKEFLSRIDFLSVREATGKRIVDSLIGEKAVVVLDPTLLITRNDWDSLVEKKKPLDEPYVFCYLLGDNVEYGSIIKQFCHDQSYKMVTVRNIETYTGKVRDVGDIILEAPSVEDFVNYIRFADVVCTDSFHCTVFSIIYHKQFVTFYRTKPTDKNSRNSRIDDFLGEIGLRNHIYNDGNTVSEIVRSRVNYHAIDSKISKLREMSNQFLANALKLK